MRSLACLEGKIANDWQTSGPDVVRDVAAGLVQLEEHGACVIADALDPALLREAREACYRAAESDRRYGLARDFQYGKDDHVNQRIWNMPSHDPVFCELAEHPLVIEMVKRTLGWPALLSSMSANITRGGGGSMLIHCDQGHLPAPQSQPWVYNFAWCLDEFTATNGATVILPGSHRLNGVRPDENTLAQMQPVIAPAGSLMVMDGRTYHTNGANTCGTNRAAIFAVYTLQWLMPQENWFLSINPSIRQFGSETLQTLFGFRPAIFGRVNGLDGI